MNGNQPPIKNVIFDLGIVLVGLDFSHMMTGLAALGVQDPQKALEQETSARLFRRFEIGQASVADIAAHVRGLSTQAPDDAAIFAAINAMILDFLPGHIAQLEALRGKYRLFLFSNTNALHHAHIHGLYRDRHGGNFDHHFEKAYYSHLLGRRKPDVESFAHIIDDAGIVAAETLFIDDVRENIQGAHRAGLQGLHLTPDKTILDLGL